MQVDWDDAMAFTTPPMLWHEHHNEGRDTAWFFRSRTPGL